MSRSSCSNVCFWCMILSEKSATFRDHALGAAELRWSGSIISDDVRPLRPRVSFSRAFRKRLVRPGVLPVAQPQQGVEPEAGSVPGVKQVEMADLLKAKVRRRKERLESHCTAIIFQGTPNGACCPELV